MQLTRFDRWLRETFVYEIHIRTLRPTESIPKGITAVSEPEDPNKRYKHLYTTRKSKKADIFIAQLKENNQMFQTEIHDRRGWHVRFCAPQDRSVTWWLITTAIIIAAVITAAIYIFSLFQNPEFRKQLDDAIQLFQ